MKAIKAVPARKTPAHHDGGCPCGQLRFRLLASPLFTHACHCRNCQRETGGPYAHHALIEHTQFQLLQGEPDFVRVPSSSGTRHAVTRCPACRAALWNEWGSGPPVVRYVRVGVLDEPARWPPQAHIFTRSRQPWVNLDGGAPAFRSWYSAAKLWPAQSLARYDAAKAARDTAQRETVTTMVPAAKAPRKLKGKPAT